MLVVIGEAQSHVVARALGAGKLDTGLEAHAVIVRPFQQKRRIDLLQQFDSEEETAVGPGEADRVA